MNLPSASANWGLDQCSEGVGVVEQGCVGQVELAVPVEVDELFGEQEVDPVEVAAKSVGVEKGGHAPAFAQPKADLFGPCLKRWCGGATACQVECPLAHEHA